MADIAETNHAMNDDYKNMSTLNTYYGILSTLYIITIKQLLLLIEFFVQVNQAR